MVGVDFDSFVYDTDISILGKEIACGWQLVGLGSILWW